MTAPSIKEALERSIVVIDDWLNVYASELCNQDRVDEANHRISNAGGTLAYIANVQQQNRAALATLQPSGERREAIALDFHTGDETPDVKRGSYAGFIVVTENDNGKHFAFAGYYLNAYPLDYGDSCPKGDGCQGDGCDDGCPTTGWFYDESNFEYENCYYPISTKVVRWAPIPKADAILASGLVQDEAAIRADEREKCAKIADREAEFWQDAESSSARIVAANIRSARTGGDS